jgi:assimilatory nitrate reductase catalytic subunit
VSGDEQHPANFGSLCVKGSALAETMGRTGRLLAPRINNQTVDWPTAIDAVASRLSVIREAYGPNAIAFYLSGQLLTEDYYVANKLAKGFVGTGHVDTNSRLCMSSAVAGYKRAFGSDAVPCSYEDLETCDLLVMTGSNAAWTHPILYRRIEVAKQRNPAMRVVVIDPRKTATCQIADMHLAIKPGADNGLFIGLLAYLVANNRVDEEYVAAHTEGFEAVADHAKVFTIEAVAQQVGLDQASLATFYEWFSNTPKTVTFYSQGINQSATGTDKCNAIINCHLATGRIGLPGAGPFSITGQPNAMGGREVGGLSNVLAAHMDYSNENIQRVGEFWGADNVSRAPGLKAVDLFDAVASGEIKAIWIIGTNPVVSMPNADAVIAALTKCETVIVSDCVAQTDTTRLADILLPACGWGEKSGTVTNSERRISRQRNLLPSQGEAQPDWWILTQVASAMGYGDAFNYVSPRDIFVEHAALSGYENNGQRLFNISALSQLSEREYDQLQPLQWPVTAIAPAGTARLFEDGLFCTTTGRAQFIDTRPVMTLRSLCADYPLALNTGRIRDQWHTMTRTGNTHRLLEHTSQPFVAINPATANDLGMQPGDLARINTAQGSMQAIAMIDVGMQPTDIFVPIHWNDQFASRARVGALVAAITDPVSGQPEFKFTPANLVKIEVQCWAIIASRTRLDCGDFLHWSLVPLNNERGYLYQVALDDAFIWGEFIVNKRLRESGPALACAQYSYAAQQDERIMCHTDQRLELVIFSHQDKSRLPDLAWLQTMFDETVEANYWRLLTARDVLRQAKGRLVCVCLRVGEKQIIDAIDVGADTIDELGERLKCGTNCGSCLPDLSMLLDERRQLRSRRIKTPNVTAV